MRTQVKSGWRYMLVLLGVMAISAHAGMIPDPKNPSTSYHTNPATLEGAEFAPGVIQDGSSSASDYFICSGQGIGVGGANTTDVWGWKSPDGTYYALVGTNDGLTVVDVTQGVAIQTVEYTPGCGWRDIKTYQHYAPMS